VRLLYVLLTIAGLGYAIAPQVTPASGQRSDASCTSLNAARYAVWAAWYAGDLAALRRMVPPDVVALDPDGSWHNLDDVLAGSRAFAEHGKLISLEFPRVVVHRTGNVAMMYSAYRTTFTYDGRRTATQGRATEEFSLRGSCWYNTGWHLDQTARPQTPRRQDG
jgi:ketosteroid isomerase-like protein